MSSRAFFKALPFRRCRCSLGGSFLQPFGSSVKFFGSLCATVPASAQPGKDQMASCNTLVQVRKVPNEILAVSEPSPRMFGNPPNERKACWTNRNWLKSRFHFSFAEYSNPHNTNFGVMRVLNDDLVQPARGFGTHPHSNMEIVTYVVDGFLTHKDSMGTEETLNRGSVQFMSAGTGVRHSEHNLDPETPLRFIQTWFQPRAKGIKPNYGSMCGDMMAEARHNDWAHLLSDERNERANTPVTIAQDVNLFVSEMDAGVRLPFVLGAGRQAYFLCMEGEVVFAPPEGEQPIATLSRHDAAEITSSGDEALQVIAGPDGAHVLYYEMRQEGRGRSDL